MGQPINYDALLTQLDFSPLVQGLQLRQANKARQAAVQLARDKFTLDQQQDAEYIQAVNDYRADPSAERLRDLSIRFPDKQEALSKAADSYDAGAKRNLVEAASSALGALAANKPDAAIGVLERRRAGLKNSNVDTTQTDQAIALIRSGDTTGARAMLSYALSGLVGGEHTASMLDTLGYGGKAEERAADRAFKDRQQSETERHNRATEGTANARVAVSAKKGAGKSKGSGKGKLPAGFILD